MKYNAFEDNREECIRSAAKLIARISHVYDHDNPDEKMHSEMYSRIAWLLEDLADNQIGVITPTIEERFNDLKSVVEENKPKDKSL